MLKTSVDRLCFKKNTTQPNRYRQPTPFSLYPLNLCIAQYFTLAKPQAIFIFSSNTGNRKIQRKASAYGEVFANN